MYFWSLKYQITIVPWTSMGPQVYFINLQIYFCASAVLSLLF